MLKEGYRVTDREIIQVGYDKGIDPKDIILQYNQERNTFSIGIIDNENTKNREYEQAQFILTF